jgi:hypothetical protein
LLVTHFSSGLAALFAAIAAGSVMYGAVTAASVALSPHWGSLQPRYK